MITEKEGNEGTAMPNRAVSGGVSTGVPQRRPWRPTVAGIRATFRRRSATGTTGHKFGTDGNNYMGMDGDIAYPLLEADNREGGVQNSDLLLRRRQTRRNSTGEGNAAVRRTGGDSEAESYERREGSGNRGNGAHRPRRRNSEGLSSSYLQSLRSEPSEARNRRYVGTRHHISKCGGLPRTSNRTARSRGRRSDRRRDSRASEMGGGGESTVASTDNSAEFSAGSAAENSRAKSLPEAYNFRHTQTSLPLDYVRRPSKAETLLSMETTAFSTVASQSTGGASSNSTENHRPGSHIHPGPSPLPTPAASFTGRGINALYPRSRSPQFRPRNSAPNTDPYLSSHYQHDEMYSRTEGPPQNSSFNPKFASLPSLPSHSVINETGQEHVIDEGNEDEVEDTSYETSSTLGEGDDSPRPPRYIDTEQSEVDVDGRAIFMDVGPSPPPFQVPEAMTLSTEAAHNNFSDEPPTQMAQFVANEPQIEPSLDQVSEAEGEEQDNGLVAAIPTPASNSTTGTPAPPLVESCEPSQQGAGATLSSTAEGTASTSAGENTRHPEDNDDIALALSESFRNGDGTAGLTLSRSLAERATFVESINWLGNHVPGCVLSCLSEEINIIMRAERARERRKKKKREKRSKRGKHLVPIGQESALAEEILSKTQSDESDQEYEAHDNGGVPVSQVTGLATKTPHQSPPRPHLPGSIGPNRPRNLLIHTISRRNLLVKSISIRSEITEASGAASASGHQQDSDDDNNKTSPWVRAGEANRKRIGGTPMPESYDRPSYSPPPTSVIASSPSFQQNLSRQPTDMSETRSHRSRSSRVNGTRRRKGGGSIARQRSTKLLRSPRVRDRKNPMVLPYATKHKCALLLVDISGFTKLSTLLDVESLSKTINSYFQTIVNEISSHGGDVLKFAGDAVFAEWQATDDPSNPGGNTSDTGSGTGSSVQTYSVAPWHGMALVECVNAAATCGAKIVSICSDYPVFSNAGPGAGGNVQGAQIATLDVHCGLGVGEVAGLHVGDDDTRREYLILGDPIDQVSTAEGIAQHGEVVASPDAMMILAKKCDFDERVLSTEFGKPAVIASRSTCYFSKKQLKRGRMSSSSSQTSSSSAPPAETLALQCESMDTASLSRLRKLIALYVHPVVVRDDLASMEHLGTRGTAETRIRAEAELRNVYVTFITPLLSAKVTGNKSEDEKLFNLLNDIMNLVTRELDRFQGHLRQYIVDDKGIVLIGTFGLKGSTFSNMVTERALPCTTIIHNALRSELGVDNHVGGTIGNVYCGVVGGLKRHEFAVLGPSVNLSARLMASKQNPGILVDNAVRLKAGKDFGFKALPPVNAKGYADPVPIFEPLTATERRWGKVKDGFTGRTNEMKKVLRTAKSMAYATDEPARMAFIVGEPGTGKSAFIVQAIERTRRYLGASRKSVIVTRNVSNKGDSLVPFSLFRSVFLDILNEIQTIDQYIDDESDVYSKTCSRAVSSTASWGQMTLSSNDSTETKSAVSNGITRLMAMCKEMDAPPEFQEIIKHHLLGYEKEKNEEKDEETKKKVAPATQSIVEFMAKAFIRCTGHAELTVLALDDVHFMDEMSWKVVQELFEKGNDILIVCSARPVSKFPLGTDSNFWKDLTTKQNKKGRFEEIELLPLSEQSILQMIAKVLGHYEVEIDGRLVRDVFMHSGGMPDIASQMMDTIKRGGLAVRLDNGLIGWSQDPNENGETSDLSVAFASIGDMILHRLDSLDDSVRSALQLAAVLDTEFSLFDVITSFEQLHAVKASDRAKQAKKVSESLEKAVTEGILEESFEGGEDDRDDASDASVNACHPFEQENRKFIFTHDVWKTTILKLLLDSRKRDIHRGVALALEQQHKEDSDVNYRSMIKLFMHWKASGDSSKASFLALKIGKSFEELGMPKQSLKVYDDALEMWRSEVGESEDEMIAGFSSQMLESIGESDVEYMIRIHIAIGKTLANTQRGKESVTAYQNALLILRSAPASEEIEDRSIVFPIFSGLFVALKMGGIEQDKDCSYEQDLVRRFVRETKVNGDPIHYARALAMQGEMYGRLGKWDLALEAHHKLQEIYDPDEHSAEICKVYSSDRAGQSFGQSALWLLRKGDREKALETCHYVIDELMPKMDPRNIHNSTVMLFAVVWIMKDHGMALEARDVMDKYVVKAFREYYSEDASTFFKSVHKLFLMNLELAGKKGEEIDELDEYVEYALKEENMTFSSAMEIGSGNIGRTMSTLFAEVCLRLAERVNNKETKTKLIQNGLKSAQSAVEITKPKDGKQGMIQGYLAAKPLAEKMECMMNNL